MFTLELISNSQYTEYYQYVPNIIIASQEFESGLQSEEDKNETLTLILFVELCHYRLFQKFS
jgi:hypothetical protein